MTALDDFGIAKKTAEGEDALGSLSATDFHGPASEHMPHSQAGANAEDRREAEELLYTMTGLVEEFCLKQTKAAIRYGARHMLNNVTIVEAQHAYERMGESDRNWYKRNSTPMSAASRLITEVSRLRSEELKPKAEKAALSWVTDDEPSAADEARRKKYLEYLEDLDT